MSESDSDSDSPTIGELLSVMHDDCYYDTVVFVCKILPVVFIGTIGYFIVSFFT